jgi:hypothetical protein
VITLEIDPIKGHPLKADIIACLLTNLMRASPPQSLRFAITHRSFVAGDRGILLHVITFFERQRVLPV